MKIEHFKGFLGGVKLETVCSLVQLLWSDYVDKILEQYKIDKRKTKK
jgi:hypothetical protein